MKPAAFAYSRPETLEAALAALVHAQGDAKIIAGGQSLVPMLNFRLLAPGRLIDITRIAALDHITERDDAIILGALTRHHVVETSPVIARHLPVVAEAMGHVAHLAIRNRGTIGGSLAHGDPAAEWPMLALLLDATLSIASPAGTREIAIANFLQGALTVDLGEEEILTQVSLPKLPAGTGWGFHEISRRTGDFALAASAVTLSVADGVVTQARIALMGVGDRALRAEESEAALVGEPLGVERIEAVVAQVRALVAPDSDLHASADYRRHLAGIMVARALADAWTRAQGGAP